MSQPPRNKPSTRQVPTRSSGSGGYGDRGARNGGRSGGSSNYGGPNRGYGPPPPRGYRNDPRYAPPPRDPFPYIMGGIIGALVVGLALVVLLLLGNKGSVANTPILSPTSAAGASGTSASSTDPPRMSMDDFKALYDNPAKRPMIIDVRALQSFDEGHIAGAISFPEADVDTRVSEIPKDKLVVAYCQ